jgi:hypothetical protein
MKNFTRFEGGRGAPELPQSINTPQCGQSSESANSEQNAWLCTRPRGHSGIHAAGNGFDAIFATWEDE